MTNLVDIIIPNYNKEKYLVECIDSVVNQTFQDWKIYLIDDCSSDRSLDLSKIRDPLFVETLECVFQMLNIYHF